MFKKSFLLGVVSGVLAGVASVIYQKVYAGSLGANFAAIAKPANIFFTCLLGGLIAGTGFWIFNKWFNGKGEIIFNVVFVLFSFASIMGAFAFKLPMDAESPELFPGLVVPMHFFPALAWFTLKPLFLKNNERYQKVVA